MFYASLKTTCKQVNCVCLCRLLRLAGIKRRSQGSPFRFIDKVSDLRQEFSFSARRIFVAAFYIFVVVHWFACTLWWTIRLQDYPSSERLCTF